MAQTLPLTTSGRIVIPSPSAQQLMAMGRSLAQPAPGIVDGAANNLASLAMTLTLASNSAADYAAAQAALKQFSGRSAITTRPGESGTLVSGVARFRAAHLVAAELRTMMGVDFPDMKNALTDLIDTASASELHALDTGLRMNLQPEQLQALGLNLFFDILSQFDPNPLPGLPEESVANARKALRDWLKENPRQGLMMAFPWYERVRHLRLSSFFEKRFLELYSLQLVLMDQWLESLPRQDYSRFYQAWEEVALERDDFVIPSREDLGFTAPAVFKTRLLGYFRRATIDQQSIMIQAMLRMELTPPNP